MIELDPNTFQDIVYSSEEPWLIELYAPWCGHCTSLRPEWAKLATSLQGKIKVAKIDRGGKTRELVRVEEKKDGWADSATPKVLDETAGNWMSKVDRLRAKPRVAAGKTVAKHCLEEGVAQAAYSSKAFSHLLVSSHLLVRPGASGPGRAPCLPFQTFLTPRTPWLPIFLPGPWNCTTVRTTRPMSTSSTG